MKTIVFAASKGGVGKTTLAFNVAAEAAKCGNGVYTADMDPQKSLETFIDIRGGDNPLMLSNVQSVGRAVADLSKSNFARDYLIVDTPGSFMPIIKDAVKAADCIVIPIQPSPIDILAQEDVVSLVRECGKMTRCFCVLNRVDGRIHIDDIVERVASISPNPVIKVRNRIAYARGLVAGRTGFEIEKDCGNDIADLWNAILRIME